MIDVTTPGAPPADPQHAPAAPGRLARAIQRIEDTLFARRAAVLVALVLLTLVMGVFALQLRMDAGFDKQLPVGHEYVQTFDTYRGDLIGANRLTVVVRARDGTIWTRAGLTRLYEVTQAVMFLPHVSRGSVTSLWTPNAFVNEITEEGFRADPLIPGTVTPEGLDDATIASIARTASQGGFVGLLVSHDQDGAMITAELNEFDAEGRRIDYVDYNAVLEALRARHEDDAFEVQMIGFAKQVGDIADGASAVLEFCLVALVLTALAVYGYCRSWRYTLLPVACSLASLVWQFGSLRLLGYGLDPLAVLVPFLVFAIGVSHGVQQVNTIVREIAHGKSGHDAARASFSALLVPGTLALVTAFVTFVTLLLIPIPMVRELAVAAALGVAYKIVTNLVMLPLAASYVEPGQAYAARQMALRERRARWIAALARLAQPRPAAAVLVAAAVVFVLAFLYSQDRVVGTLEPGAPELRPEARFNRDAVSIASSFDMGLDWLTVVFEAPPDSCEAVAIGQQHDRFVLAMRGVPGVQSIDSYATQLRQYNEGYNEGNPKMSAVPIDPANYSALSFEVGRAPGTMRKDCSMTAAHLYLADHRTETIERVLDAAKAFRDAHPLPGLALRLAAGNAGVLAAVNDAVATSELPMMLYVYAVIVLLVFAVYRDWRAVLACCLPLTVGTFVGYAFMKALDIGLTVATLPVMVLAVGIGVDYAFYIYNRLQLHLAAGRAIGEAVGRALQEVGVATIFTAITLAIGVATWSFSALKFQADMGKLLAFMFMINMVMAMTVLPAFAVWIDRLIPRRRPARAPGMLGH
ncbi:MAG: MMPL family transporter [Burkholderiales bacterium]|nr:MMPL family transporter [Burkholderiales bacterium]